MVQPGRSLSAAFFRKVRSLDWTAIAYELMHATTGPQWTETKTRKAIARYLAFLALMQRYPQLPLVPTREIDSVWRCHSQDIWKYIEDCRFLLGDVIHALPPIELGEDVAGNVEQYADHLTACLFRYHFGGEFRIDSDSLSDTQSSMVKAQNDGTQNPTQCYSHPAAVVIGQCLYLFPIVISPLETA